MRESLSLDLHGVITGAHRTWLDRNDIGKAPIGTQRKGMGRLLGNTVHFGPARDVMAAGEGIETMLSLRMALPDMSMMAALSAAHLSAILFPAPLRQLYIACETDPATEGAAATLPARAEAIGIEVLPLVPRLGDFNEDLVAFGAPVQFGRRHSRFECHAHGLKRIGNDTTDCFEPFELTLI